MMIKIRNIIFWIGLLALTVHYYSGLISGVFKDLFLNRIRFL